MTAKIAILAAGICVFCGICEASGTHIRLRTPHGAVHIWTPDGYDRESAGVVVYVHGYFTDVDHAWKEHRLAEQFAASHLNALFIACEAPDGPRGAVRWASLNDLLETVGARVPGGLPEGRITALGHSGAHRTIVEWLDDPRLDTVVLVDALYGNVDKFHAWLEADDARRLIDVAALTRAYGDALHALLPDTVTFDELPAPHAGTMRGARSARVIYVRTDTDHMELVTGGVAIPLVLRALQLPLVDDIEETRDAA